MRPIKPVKIELNRDYPCPCRRRGRLSPIILTEAFGCDRCQQIFVLQENGQAIEQVSSPYPYKRAWRWSGSRWIALSPKLAEGYLSVALGILLLLLIIWLPLALKSPSGLSIICWAVLLVLLLTILFSLAYRR